MTRWLKNISTRLFMYRGSAPAPRRDGKLRDVPGRKLVHPADCPGGRAHQPDRLAAGDQAFHRVLAMFPDDRRRSLALERGAHDAGRISRRRSIRGIWCRSIACSSPSSTSASFAISAKTPRSTASTWPAARCMEDLDNDGLLDLAMTSFDPTLPMALYRNEGDGTFKDLAETAGLDGQLGGKNWSRPISTTTVAWISSSRGARGSTPRSARACSEQRRRHVQRRDRARRGSPSRSIRRIRAGPITTTTAGSTSTSSASGSRTTCTITAATGPSRK